MLTPVTVIGGTGRVGRRVAKRLLQNEVEVRLVSRNPGRAHDLAADGARLFAGDIRDPETLEVPCQGTRGVLISVEPGTAQSGPDSPESTMYTGVQNVLKMCPRDIERFVLVSQIYVTRPDHPINAMGGMLDWRLRGEEEVRASGFPFTIIRPSWFSSTRSAGPAVVLEQGDTGDGEIAIPDVADACFQAFAEPAAAGKTFEIYNGPGPPDTDWPALFAGLTADAGISG
jgi:uncharacterized protein YbjT (DUF2867 family)